MSRISRSIDDVERALSMLVALAGDPDDVRYLVIPGDPASKSRPRFTRTGRTYTSAQSRAAEKHAAGIFKRSFPEPMTGNAAMACIFHRSNHQRIDTDNMLKLICDAANGIAWVDDSQVTAILGVVELDEADPRTLVAISPHVSTMLRGTNSVRPCDHCGQPFDTRGVSTSRRFCGRECAYAARVNVREPVDCRQCGQPFRRTTNRQVLCSEACRAAWLTGQNKAGSGPNSTCAECGAELSHKRGGRCRSCWRASPHARPADAPPPRAPIPVQTIPEGS